MYSLCNVCRIANLGLVHEFRLSRTGVIAENSGSVLHQSEFGRVAGLNDCIESRMKNSAKLQIIAILITGCSGNWEGLAGYSGNWGEIF